ncbi:MAG: MFS transporter, partial [Pseudolabrys sp.]|nr:MFS transporter [Pseudolabrys sp.]
MTRRYKDILLLLTARGLRGFGDGFAIIILPAYLAALGYDAAQIGLVATSALLGTALLTLGIGFVAPRHDLRALLMASAGLMAATGLVFPQFEHVGLVVAVA